MEDIIQLLPDSVANQIAAGEVIQRPASVVKELVENSIDAGATSVQIVIKDAGRTLIQIIDNGCGMSTTDARMAFERHATSKIRQATDLFSLHTMGFRGEALPSVAAVSDIEMRSMRRDDDIGTHIEISASKVLSQIPEMTVPGTNIMVKRLFFNLPARRKFLKKDSIELGHIMREFERLALVNTNVDFSITHNDILLHKLTAGQLKQRIIDLFGKTFQHHLIPVETETSIVRISGFIGAPEGARKRNAQQFLFVNGRYMRHAYFHKAIVKCYEELITTDSQPNYFINFTVDPETIDVNIHPQKYEIKFENEQPVWQILQAAVKEALGRFSLSSTLDFDSADALDIPAFNPEEIVNRPFDDSEEADSSYNPFDSDSHKQSIPTDWEKLYENFTSRQASSIEHVRGSAINSGMTETISRLNDELNQSPDLIASSLDLGVEILKPTVFQLSSRYIVSPSSSGIMIIDQHRAHTLILFERYVSQINNGDIASQRLIFPESVTLDATQNIIASSIDELLQSMGFEISNLGDNIWAINAVPAVMYDKNPVKALTDIISSVAEEDEDLKQSQWEKIAHSVAKSSAITYGTNLTQNEMDNIVSDLFKLSAPNYTPDGKLVFTTIELSDITRLF